RENSFTRRRSAAREVIRCWLVTLTTDASRYWTSTGKSFVLSHILTVEVRHSISVLTTEHSCCSVSCLCQATQNRAFALPAFRQRVTWSTWSVIFRGYVSML